MDASSPADGEGGVDRATPISVSADPPESADDAASARLRGELSTLSLGALKARARAAGVGEEVLQAADGTEAPNQTIIELLLANTEACAAQPVLDAQSLPEAVPPTDATVHSAAQPDPQLELDAAAESPQDGIAWKVQVSAARGLLLADVDALGSAFAVVSWGGSSVRSTSRPNTVDPVWQEVLQIPLPLDRDTDSEFGECLATNPYCAVEVFDERGHSGKPECIGQLMLSLVQLSQQSGAPASWRRLSAPPRLAHQRPPAPGTLYGEIELSITLADPRFKASLIGSYGAHGVLRQKADAVLASAAQLALPVFSHDSDEESTTIEYPRAVEAIEVVLSDVKLRMSGYSDLGCVLLTSHRLIFAADREETAGPSLSMEVPVAAVSVAKMWENRFSSISLTSVLLRCSDFRSITLSATTLQSSKCLGGIVDRLQLLQTELGDAPCSLAPSTEELWTIATAAGASAETEPMASKITEASRDPRAVEPPVSGFRLDLVEEFKQQGVPAEIFRSVTNGQAIPLCETYPETIMVPAATSSDIVLACADAWAGRRLPVLTYWRTHRESAECAGLFRSATPSVQRATGTDARQELLEAIRDVSQHAAAAATAVASESGSASGAQPTHAPSPRTVQQRAEVTAMYPDAVLQSGAIGRLLIADCRSSVAAVGHALAGAVSTVAPILGVDHIMVDLANHHAVRASIDALRQLVHDERDSATGESVRAALDPSTDADGTSTPLMGDGSSIGDVHMTWSQELAGTQWLAHVAILLDGAVRVSWAWLARGGSLIVQCATGRDRSAQLSALIQLLLEPRYRSKTGFAKLVQKEFGAFGFAFSQRLGTASAPTERSPIFLQFLDAVHQLRRQCPESFEFSDAFLVDLAIFSGSEWWSDFLFDDERTRLQQQLGSRCPSVWDWMLAPGARSASGQSYTCADYTKTSDMRARSHGILPVRVGVRHLAFWSSLFLRYDADSLRAGGMASSPPSTSHSVAAASGTLGTSSEPDASGVGRVSRVSTMAGGTGKAVKWHPHAPGRALIEGGVELSALQPELVNDTVLYKFELRVGLTTAGVLQTRYSTARAAHQSLSKQGGARFF